MTPERREKNRARMRLENMSPEAIDRQRAERRIANMTPEQIEKVRARNAARMYAGSMYLGTVGFSKREVEAIVARANRREIHGTTD
jgi:hypothetical protein